MIFPNFRDGFHSVACGCFALFNLRLVKDSRAPLWPKGQGVLCCFAISDLNRSLQEVSDAILSFRSSGKVTVAWSDSFDSNSEYALACACQYIFVQPSGQVWLTGLNFEVQFIGSLLKRCVECHTLELRVSETRSCQGLGFTV